MRVWLLSIGEPLPCEGNGNRLWRTGNLAKSLADKGHQVTWWTSTFNHKEKRQLVSEDSTWTFMPNCKIRLLHAPSYKKNISLKRLRNHRQLADKFMEEANKLSRPDVIVSSLPTLDFCSAAIDYGSRYKIPVVLDIRDLWPDIFVDFSPSILRGLTRQIFSPFFKQAEAACAGASALTGITEEFVDWGLEKAVRSRNKWDCAFPMGYSQCAPSKTEIKTATLFWKTHGITSDNGEFTVCFFGTLGRHFESSTVMRAAKQLAHLGCPVRFVLCGSGEKSKEWNRLAANLSNVTMPGWVSASQIWTLMRISKTALAPYVSSHDFSRSLPNKSIEYLSAGLPIVSSLRGVLSDLLSQNDSGITYDNGSAEQLTEAILRLQGNPNFCNTLSINAANLFRKKFIAEEIYSAMADHLLRVATEGVFAQSGRVELTNENL